MSELPGLEQPIGLSFDELETNGSESTNDRALRVRDAMRGEMKDAG
jgi:hypothetical protein